jgi:hypothetical protein
MPRHAAKLGVALRRILGPTHGVDDALVVCQACGSDFVNPVSWHEQGRADWWIRLRCGGCGFVREVEVSNDEAERYDAELDRGIAKIALTLATLDRARMLCRAEVDRVEHSGARAHGRAAHVTASALVRSDSASRQPPIEGRSPRAERLVM